MNDKLLNILFYVFVLVSAGVLTWFGLLDKTILLTVFMLAVGHAGANLPTLSGNPSPPPDAKTTN